MNSTVLAAAAAAGGIGGRPPFTAAQWQELEHQALIYKYLMAGVPVPPELLIPIQRSFEALPGRYYHPALGRSLSSVGYCSYYGKKLDPEPGRCRRTDGKKWRCSKDAHPDSKYCERHMHRGRNRSRKPVESESNSQLQSSSTATSPTPTASSAKASGGGGFQTVQQSVAVHSNKQTLCLGASSSLHLPMDQGPWGNRYFSGVKPGVDGHTFFPEVSGTARGLGMDSMDSPWHLMPSRVSPSSFPSLKAVNPALQNTYPQLSSVQELRQVTTSSISRQQQLQHSFSGGEFDPQESTKHEGQFLRVFFDDWPKPRDSWSDLEEETSNRSLYSTTQHSMSFPMASQDFSATSSRSPNSESVTTAALTPEI